MVFSLEAQQARINNIKFAEEHVFQCARKTRIRNYMPGQVTYSLGDYPSKISAMPTEYDYNLLKSLSGDN